MVTAGCCSAPARPSLGRAYLWLRLTAFATDAAPWQQHPTGSRAQLGIGLAGKKRILLPLGVNSLLLDASVTLT